MKPARLKRLKRAWAWGLRLAGPSIPAPLLDDCSSTDPSPPGSSRLSAVPPSCPDTAECTSTASDDAGLLIVEEDDDDEDDDDEEEAGGTERFSTNADMTANQFALGGTK